MSWGRLPRPNPCLPCMVGNPKKRRKNACPPSVHIDMPGAHAAYGRGSRTNERNANPKLMVLNPSSPLEAACAKKLGRRLSSKEKSLLTAACREFKTFHGREPKAEDLVPVDVPPGTPMFVMGIGKVERQNYTVPMESERRGKWTHKAGDHGGKHETKAPWFASIPGRSKHNVVIAQPPGAKTYFKPTHGLMG